MDPKRNSKILSDDEIAYFNTILIRPEGNYFDASNGKKNQKNLLFLDKPLQTH